ncbi:MAG TPA: hypothetical protein PKN75_03675 [Bacteroidia bacterium]|nr:hypothetical protein [Bacteroidia bacterium]HNU32669.1 hypothetical protein [Bacteroidia bacterium]
MSTLKHALLAIAFILSNVSLAQPPGGGSHAGGPPDGKMREKIKTMKIGFITQKLDLTSDEAKVFWPVYNGYESEMETLRKQRRGERKEARQEFENMSDKDAEKIVDDEIAFRQKELDVQKKYHAQFKQVLPSKKVAILYRSEEDFKRELLERIRERKEDKKEMRKGGGR